MEQDDRNTIHGTVKLRSGNREDLFSPDVIDILANIICTGRIVTGERGGEAFFPETLPV